MKYQVVYIENGLPDQTLTKPLDFQEAHDMAILLAADNFKDNGDSKAIVYLVQPHNLARNFCIQCMANAGIDVSACQSSQNR